MICMRGKGKFTALICAAAAVFSAVSAVIAVPAPTVTAQTGITITNEGGCLESAYVTWTDSSPSEGYSVYVKGGIYGDYTKIDSQLVRTYGDYYRADALGLPAGTYTLKIEDNEGETAQTSELTVTAHTREGFAFSQNSANKTASGGYNDDGSVPSDAVIIYITNDNVKTVTATVYNGSKTYECTGLEEILQYIAKGDTKHHYIIRVIGTLEFDLADKGSGIYVMNSNGYMVFQDCSNVTIEGVGSDATVKYCGLLLKRVSNMEVRNLGIMLFGDDGISIDTGNENVWVHNNDVFYGSPGKDSDQVKGDGSIDCKKSKYVTISMNHFWDGGKASLVDASPSTDTANQSNYITYHHNWFDHSDSRHPRIRHATVHMYNNYFDGNAKYGTGVTSGASAFVEANVYRNCKHPFFSSEQGSEGGNSLSNEAGGIIKAYNNKIEGGAEIIYASPDNRNDFDAYLAAERDEQVSAEYTTLQNTFKSQTYPNTYSNFDTDASIMYEYTPDSTDDVAAKVEKYAGRGENGDFKYEFDDSTADSSYNIDETLKTKLIDYQSSLKGVFDDVKAPAVPTPGPATPTPGAVTEQPQTQLPTETQTPADKPEETEKPSESASPLPDGTLVWYGGEAYEKGDALTIPGLTANDKMSSGAADVSFNGITFSGSSRAAANGTADGTGAIKFVPESDGSFSVYFKSDKESTFYIKDSDGNTLASYTNDTGSNGGKYVTAEVEKGKTYYAYEEGKRVYFYGASFSPDADVPPTEPTETPAVPDYELSGELDGAAVTVTVKNNTANTEKAYAAAAAYDGEGVLCGVKLIEFDFTDSSVQTVSEEFYSEERTAELRIMLWRDMKNMLPLSEVCEIRK